MSRFLFPLSPRSAGSWPAAAALLLAAPAASVAQSVDAPAPSTPQAPAPNPRVQGPPDGMIQPGPAVPARPLPTVPVLPRSQPAPPLSTAPTPTPEGPSPSPRPARPAARPQDKAPPVAAAPSVGEGRAADAPALAPPSPSPSTPAPAPAPAPLNETQDAPALPPDGPATDTPAAGLGWFPWLAGLAALAGLAGLFFWLRRTRTGGDDPVSARADADAPSPIAPLPIAPPQPPPAPLPTPARRPGGARARLALRFEPVQASTTLVNFRLRYAITLDNGGERDAADVIVRIGLFAGTSANPAGIDQWLARADDGGDQHRIAHIAAGASHRFEGELAAPLAGLAPLTMGDRAMAVPIVAVDARYGHAADVAELLAGQTARAFVVGREPALAGGDAAPPARLAPFRLDQGPATLTGLGQRDTGIGRTE